MRGVIGKLDTGTVREASIRQEKIVGLSVEKRAPLLAISRGINLVAFVEQDMLDRKANIGVVFDEEDARHGLPLRRFPTNIGSMAKQC